MAEALGPQCLNPSRGEFDLLDFQAVQSYLASNDVNSIVHAAGFVGGIGLNKAHPGRMLTDNLRMGLNVLEAAAKQGNTRVTVVSTICVYPQDAPIPTPESAMYDGYPADETAFYGIAKRTLHTAAEGLRRELGLSFAYVIPTNLYGPGDHFEESKSHVIPALIRRALEAKESGATEFVAWGDGSQTRDLLFVEDAVKGILAAHNSQTNGEVFNLGSGVEVSVRQMVETVFEVVGFQGEIKWDTSKPGGAPRRALDGSKAENILGFKPTTDFREGMRQTVDWYLRNRALLPA